MLTLLAIETPQKTIELSTGAKLAYVEQGDPRGVPVLLLHSLTSAWHSFELLLPHLPGVFNVFALSLPGHGNHGRPVEGYRSQAFTADVAAFIEALKLGPAVIVGHAMDSAVAQRFALDYPEYTLGLALLGARTTFQGNPALDVAVARLEEPIEPGFGRGFQEGTRAQPVRVAADLVAFTNNLVLRSSLNEMVRFW